MKPANIELRLETLVEVHRGLIRSKKDYEATQKIVDEYEAELEGQVDPTVLEAARKAATLPRPAARNLIQKAIDDTRGAGR